MPFTLSTLLIGAKPLVGQQPATPAAASPVAAPQLPMAFTDVTVIDVRNGRLRPRQTVVIRGNRISAVGPTTTVRVPSGTRVVQARGRYLIPGLWDMHAHVSSSSPLPLHASVQIANGVTGVRIMRLEPSFDEVRQWRQDVAAGVRVGPRQLWASDMMAAFDPAEARRAVDSFQAGGVDFIKAYWSGGDGGRPGYFAAAAEARRIGIPFDGHLPSDVSLLQAADSGQRTVEHLMYPISHGQLDGTCDGETASLAKCAALARQLSRKGLWITPTAVLMTLFSESRFWPIRSHLPYLPDSMRHLPDSTRPTRADTLYREHLRGRLTNAATRRDSVIVRTREALGLLSRAGMPLLAGTDGDQSEFLVHEELAYMVQACGMTPLAALQTATLNPAKALHATDSLGTIAAGKLADLVLLDANPLADITNTTKIRAVVANGRFYDRDALDALLAEVQRRAGVR